MENNQRPQAKPITLSVQHLEVLENFISEMPTKYGVALLNFLSQVAKEQDSAETVEEQFVFYKYFLYIILYTFNIYNHGHFKFYFLD